MTVLSDPELDAVIIATSDAFRQASMRALEAGKHVLCEKPIGVSLDEAEALGNAVESTGKVLQVGHMKRFDAGLEQARDFVRDEMGEILALKGMVLRFNASVHGTDCSALPVPASTPANRARIEADALLRWLHGSHLFDTARFLCGDIVEVSARLTEKFGAYSWFVDVTFAKRRGRPSRSDAKVRMDWHEGLQLYGEHGSIVAKTYNPWYFKSSEVDIFSEKDACYRRPWAQTATFTGGSLKALRFAILDNTPPHARCNYSGDIARSATMIATAQSAQTQTRSAIR